MFSAFCNFSKAVACVGAGGDLQQVQQMLLLTGGIDMPACQVERMARSMVTQFGMSEVGQELRMLAAYPHIFKCDLSLRFLSH